MNETEPQGPLFILGAQRSGTTQVLRLCRDVYGYRGGEEGRVWASVHALDAHFRRVELDLLPISNSRLSDFTLLRLTRAQLVARYVAMLLEMHVETYGSPLVDKALGPEAIQAAPLIAEAAPHARFLFMRRRGIENVLSQMRRFPNSPFETACLIWARTMNAWRRTRESLGASAIEIDQRDLEAAAQSVARALTNFLGHGDADAASRYLTTHFPEKTSKGGYARYLSFSATGWNHDQRQIFHEICSEEMAAYGYSLSGDSPTPAGEKIDFAAAPQLSRWTQENGNSWILTSGPGLRLHPNFGDKGPAVLRCPAALEPGEYSFEAEIVVFDARCQPHCIELSLGGDSQPAKLSIRLEGAMQGRVEWSQPKIAIRAPANLELSIALEEGIVDAAFSATQITSLAFTRLTSD